LANGDATVLVVLGHAYSAAHQLDAAELATLDALRFDGSSAWGWGRSGWIETYRGRPEAAVERLAMALEFGRDDPLAQSFRVGLGCAHFEAGRYAESVRWLERAAAERPPAAWAHRVLCPAYALAGRKAEASASLAIVRRAYPDVTISEVVSALPATASFRDRMAEGLEGAGLSRV
jgi:tetratricopeptide (TPR) repeat protein